MPLIAERSVGGCAYPSVNPYGISLNPPPRMNRPPLPAEFSHHSRTLPARSYTPYTPMLRGAPPRTGDVLSNRLPGTMKRAACVAAARDQWYTVGNDFPANFAYADASYQLTPPTGKSACPAGNAPASHVDG